MKQTDPTMIDFSLPFMVRTIFKSSEKPAHMSEEYDEILAKARGESNEPKEYDAMIAAEWSSIIAAQSYPYEDDNIWIKFEKIPKFYLILRDLGSYLVEGDFMFWFEAWSLYKKQLNSNGTSR